MASLVIFLKALLIIEAFPNIFKDSFLKVKLDIDIKLPKYLLKYIKSQKLV
jgi:hypothetical protein